MKSKLTQIVIGVAVVVGLFGCAKTDNNNNGVHQYSMNQNGVCMDLTTGAQAAPAYCNGMTSAYGGGYYLTGNGTICMSSATQQQVPLNYCQNAAGMGNQCYGQYVFTQSGYMQQVTCNGANCRGYTLIQQSTGTTVYCQ